MSLPVKFEHRVSKQAIYSDPEELIEALAELAGFTAFKVVDDQGSCEGYYIEANDEGLREFLRPKSDNELIEEQLASDEKAYYEALVWEEEL